MDEDRRRIWVRHMPLYYTLCDKVNFSGQDTRYVTDCTEHIGYGYHNLSCPFFTLFCQSKSTPLLTALVAATTSPVAAATPAPVATPFPLFSLFFHSNYLCQVYQSRKL